MKNNNLKKCNFNYSLKNLLSKVFDILDVFDEFDLIIHYGTDDEYYYLTNCYNDKNYDSNLDIIIWNIILREFLKRC